MVFVCNLDMQRVDFMLVGHGQWLKWLKEGRGDNGLAKEGSQNACKSSFVDFLPFVLFVDKLLVFWCIYELRNEKMRKGRL